MSGLALTKAQKRFVIDGCIHGDFQMRTVRALRQKGLFDLEVNSPNGRAGFMRLTEFGKAVQAKLSGANK
jgi:hypothetical protein